MSISLMNSYVLLHWSILCKQVYTAKVQGAEDERVIIEVFTLVVEEGDRRLGIATLPLPAEAGYYYFQVPLDETRDGRSAQTLHDLWVLEGPHIEESVLTCTFHWLPYGVELENCLEVVQPLPSQQLAWVGELFVQVRGVQNLCFADGRLDASLYVIVDAPVADRKGAGFYRALWATGVEPWSSTQQSLLIWFVIS